MKPERASGWFRGVGGWCVDIRSTQTVYSIYCVRNGPSKQVSRLCHVRIVMRPSRWKERESTTVPVGAAEPPSDIPSHASHLLLGADRDADLCCASTLSGPTLRESEHGQCPRVRLAGLGLGRRNATVGMRRGGRRVDWKSPAAV